MLPPCASLGLVLGMTACGAAALGEGPTADAASPRVDGATGGTLADATAFDAEGPRPCSSAARDCNAVGVCLEVGAAGVVIDGLTP